MSKILVVEDNDSYSTAIVKHLIKAGHEVAIVQGSEIPQEAINKVSSLVSTLEQAHKTAGNSTDIYNGQKESHRQDW